MTRVRINYPENPQIHGTYASVVSTKPGYRSNQHEVILLVGRGVYRPGDTVFLSSEHVVEVE